MNGKILIVDDSLTVRMDLTEALEAAGFNTVHCGTIAAARQVLRQEPILLAVLDVLLPDGDGIDLLKEIRALKAKTVPILMLSSEAEVKDRIRGLQTGADDYVGKPYDTAYVVARVRELLHGQEHPSPVLENSAILVIDDSATFREEMRSGLTEAGYFVLTAADGEEGLKIAVSRRPRALIVDGVLPGIDGATVIRRIRLDSALRGMACLLLTASEDHRAELNALDAGADAFVRKEDDLQVILARLSAVLRSAGKEHAEAASLLGPKRILAVDDSLTYLHELASVLRVEGYDVVLAHSGEEALDMLAAQPVDCILLDLLMPGLSGKDTCRQIKTSPVVREIPLIMITAMEDREAMIEGLSTGADDYISKSSEFEVLKARVRAQLRRKQFEDEHRKIREDLLRSELDATDARAARKLAEAKAAMTEELERKNKELEAFSYSVSHDLRAPLRGIDGFCAVLLKEYGDKIDEKGRDYLARVRNSAKRMSELINDLLELSRVSRAELTRSAVKISDIVKIVAQDLQLKDAERKVRLSVREGLTAEADSRLVRVLLENLLGNAWKFTSKTASPQVVFDVEVRGAETIYVVRDNGAGFNMAYAQKLFTPFQRLHSDTDFPGTGIGLATVSRIVDRHGGRVWAEGVEGQGASIFFTLPPPRAGV